MEDNRMYKGPDGTALRFFYAPSKNNHASTKHGRPIYDKVLLLEVLTPGSNESMPQIEMERTFCEESGIKEVRRNAKYCEKYAEQLRNFKENNEGGALSGTPLSQWPAIDVAQAATLKAMNIHTVQQLAQVQDSHLFNLGTGARHLREMARSFTLLGGNGTDNSALLAEKVNLETEVERLKGEVKELNDRLTVALAERDAMAALAPKPDTGKAAKAKTSEPLV